jgi:hypothetical protein
VDQEIKACCHFGGVFDGEEVRTTKKKKKKKKKSEGKRKKEGKQQNVISFPQIYGCRMAESE